MLAAFANSSSEMGTATEQLEKLVLNEVAGGFGRAGDEDEVIILKRINSR
jgi:hypothetical protein